jgi:hypothetical protein
VSDSNLEAAMHIREAAQKHQKLVDNIRSEYRKKLEALLLGKGAPEDMPNISWRKHHCYNHANAIWRQHIRNVLGGKS